MCFAVLRSPPSPSFFKSAVYQRDSSPPQKVCLKNWVLHISLLLKRVIVYFTCFSERELRFTFAIWYRPSVCRLSVSVCLSICVRVCCSLTCSRCLLPCSFDERKLSSISDVRFTCRSPRHSTYVGLHNCFSYFHEAGFLNRMLFLILSFGRETVWSVINIRRRLLLIYSLYNSFHCEARCHVKWQLYARLLGVQIWQFLAIECMAETFSFDPSTNAATTYTVSRYYFNLCFIISVIVVVWYTYIIYGAVLLSVMSVGLSVNEINEVRQQISPRQVVRRGQYWPHW